LVLKNLYADDNVIILDDPTDFEICLNAFNSYCRQWDLTVNLNKTEVIVLGCRSARNYEFKLGDNILDFSALNFQIPGHFFMLANTLLSRQKRNILTFL
jgi:hypothetical protein